MGMGKSLQRPQCPIVPTPMHSLHYCAFAGLPAELTWHVYGKCVRSGKVGRPCTLHFAADASFRISKNARANCSTIFPFNACVGFLERKHRHRQALAVATMQRSHKLINAWHAAARRTHSIKLQVRRVYVFRDGQAGGCGVTSHHSAAISVAAMGSCVETPSCLVGFQMHDVPSLLY